MRVSLVSPGMQPPGREPLGIVLMFGNLSEFLEALVSVKRPVTIVVVRSSSSSNNNNIIIIINLNGAEGCGGHGDQIATNNILYNNVRIRSTVHEL